MRLSLFELGVVVLIIGYIAFFTHPVPSHLADFLSSPVGKVVALLGVLYVTVYQSMIIGIFLGLAFLLSVRGFTEYMDEKEQTPKKQEAQPKSKGVPPPAITGALKSMLTKGDTRLPQISQKKGTPMEKPSSAAPAKPAAPKAIETFASF